MSQESAQSEESTRHYGLELEYLGVPLPEAAEIVADITGGTVHEDYSTKFTVKTDDLGDFTIELDVELAQKISKRAEEQKSNPDQGLSIEELADYVVPGLLGPVAPSEIVTPPLKLADIAIVEKIVEELRYRGARGTSHSLLYAFGYHINPEVLSIETREIRDTIRAFILLYDWLMTRLDMDVTRKITGFAGPYSEEYARFVLTASYDPDMNHLIEDYIHFNPSRNYALDLLPLFSHIDEDLVASLIEDSLIKKRPTYHFRMPNCSIDDPDWHVNTALDCWFTVEDLARHKTLLQELSVAYTIRHKELFSRIDPHWVAFVQDRLNKAGINHA
ncbi:MAG: amidoligase family protein [Pseudomonadota bacterium]